METPFRKSTLAGSVALAVIVWGAGLVQAEPARTIINGGGITQNNNSGFGALLAIGGFVAQETGPAVSGISPAKGQIQAKSVVASDPLNALLSIHGRVVCIANRGDGSGFGGTNADVWEVRFQITRVDGPGLTVGNYGSLFVQDNSAFPGEVDMGDESFANPLNAACGIDGPFGLEPVLAGNFTVHTP